MSTVELREHIVYRLANIYDRNVLEEINTILDYQVVESVFQCSREQRKAITQAQQTVAKGDKISHEEMKKAVELWLSEN